MRSYDEPLKIAFSKQISGNYQVFTINIDGTEEKQLTSVNGEDSGAPSWSADGEHIVFSRFITALARSGIWVMNYDGTDQKQLTAGANIDQYPTWSPEGKRIVFIRNGSGTYTMNADGSSITQISANDFRCSWSPDGTRLIYSTSAGNIFSMKPDGTDIIQITGTTLDWTPTWSPDGKMFAYQDGTTDPIFQIYIMNNDGTGRIQVTTLSVADGHTQPTWSPDSNVIAFWQEFSTSIYIINTDGTEMRLLVQNGDSPCFQGKPR